MKPFKTSVYFLYAIVFVQAGFSKLIAFKVPEWFLKQFEGTFLNLFDGSLHLQFSFIVLAEVVLGLVAMLGLFNTLQTKATQNTDKFLFIGSSILFAGLCFGQRLTFNFDTAAFLFFYSVASAYIYLTLQKEGHEKS